jgi:2-C-methyl-D-erythritol 4-phosphate cytidylyltransferase
MQKQQGNHGGQVAAVIVAAGSSRRMLGRDKLWTPLAGRITLARTLEVFQSSPLIDSIVIVTNQEHLADVADLAIHEDWHKVAAIVPGGARRQDSVRLGLDTLATITPLCSWVMIHDAARPFVTHSMLEHGLRAAQQYQAAIAAVPVKDTIKQVEGGIIASTLDRSQLWLVQTPQVFAFPLIQSAHHTPLAQEDVTDDATLLERLGHSVAIFEGSYANIKITTQEDLLLAELMIQEDRL